MKPFPIGLDTLLATREYVFCDLYEFVLSGGDVYTVLLPFDGTNGSTTFLDYGGHAWTPNGNVHIDTAQSKFGGASAAFDGAGDFLTSYGSDLNFGVRDFTVEFWVQANALGPGVMMIFDQRPAVAPATTHSFAIYAQSDNSIRMRLDIGTDVLISTTVIGVGAWHHVMLTRASGVTRLFIDGVQEGGTYADANDYYASSLTEIGADINGALGFNGWIDQFRTIKGVAAHTSNFTPPTAPYATGTFLRYTTADTDVTYLGNTYTSKGPFFDSLQSRATGHWKAGLDVDTWVVTIAPLAADPISGASYPAQILSHPWMSAARNGALDGAVVAVHRAYWAAWPSRPYTALTPTYVLRDYFTGRVAAVDMTRTEAHVTINSHMELLARPVPREVYQAACRHTLFDVGCTLNRAAFAVAGSVTAVTDGRTFSTNLAQAAGYFTLGMLTWLTGNNAGFSRSVRSYATVGNVVLISPMPYAIAPGDTFTVYPGCDKTMATCTNKFANLVNFGGQPFIPAPEAAV